MPVGHRKIPVASGSCLSQVARTTGSILAFVYTAQAITAWLLWWVTRRPGRIHSRSTPRLEEHQAFACRDHRTGVAIDDPR